MNTDGHGFVSPANRHEAPRTRALLHYRRAMACREAQARLLGVGAAIDRLEANSADTNVPLASGGEFFPVAGAFATVEVLAIKDACHGAETGVEWKNVKPVGRAVLQCFKWRSSNSSAAACASAG